MKNCGEAVKEQSQVDEQLRELCTQIASIEDFRLRLEERLTPVLLIEESLTEKDTPYPQLVPLAGELRAAAHRLQDVHVWLLNMFDRIEL